MRLFVALALPATVIAELELAQQHLRRNAQHPVAWVKPSSIHLTLQFLGEVEEDRVPAILEALQAINPPRDIGLRLARASAFPSTRRPQTLWMGVSGDLAALNVVQHTIVATLTSLGFPPEDRPFHPHLTLGRVRRDATPAQRSVLSSALETLPPPAPLSWPSGLPILYQSTLTTSGAIYRALSQP